MKLPDEDKAIADIATEFKVQISAADRLFDYVAGTLHQATAGGNSEHLNACLSAVIIRLLRLHYTAVKLSSIGVASEAKIQIRAMLEICINLYALKYASSPMDYARKWMAWDLHNYMKQVETDLKRNPENRPLFEEHFRIANSVKAEMASIAQEEWNRKHPVKFPDINDYVAHRWKTFLSRGPSLLDLKSLAISADKASGGATQMANTYDYVYPNSSGVAHGSDLASMISFNTETNITLKLAPTRDSINTVLVTSTCLLQTGASIICPLLKLGGESFSTETFEIAKSGVVA